MVSEFFEDIFEVKFKRDANTGCIRAEYWLLNGVEESPSEDRPSTILYDSEGRIQTMLWKKQGRFHREEGPAWIEIEPKNRVHTSEMFYFEGRCHRSNRQPAQIERHAISGEITKVRYFEHGVEKHWRKLPPVASGP